MNKEAGTYYITDEYDIFKFISGNREEIDEQRIAKVTESIKKVGFVESPILCNEKMEVIDGQARLEACRRLNVPVYYNIANGVGIDECIAMNISSTNWKMKDFIKSYADRGVSDYILIQKLIDESGYSYNSVIYALFKTTSRNMSENIKAGTVKVDNELYQDALRVLKFWDNFSEIECNRKEDLLVALYYCTLMEDVDIKRLIDKVLTRKRDFLIISNITDAVGVIEDAYNSRIRNHVYIETEYYKILNERTNDGGMMKIKRAITHK